MGDNGGIQRATQWEWQVRKIWTLHGLEDVGVPRGRSCNRRGRRVWTVNYLVFSLIRIVSKPVEPAALILHMQDFKVLSVLPAIFIGTTIPASTTRSLFTAIKVQWMAPSFLPKLIHIEQKDSCYVGIHHLIRSSVTWNIARALRCRLTYDLFLMAQGRHRSSAQQHMRLNSPGLFSFEKRRVQGDMRGGKNQNNVERIR